MSSLVQGECLLTELDHARLSKLQDAARGSVLADLLAEADLVPSPSVPADVVTMYSQVLVRDHASDAVRKLTLCYPGDAEPDAGFISVLSPMGAALIGRRVGDRMRSPLPTGQALEMTLEAILFQPEASGDYST